MPYVITQAGDEPILLIEFSSPFDARTELFASRAEILSLIGDVSRPFFAIYDVRKISITLDDLIIALTESAYPLDAKGIFQKYGRMCIVGGGPMITLGVESANRFIPSSGTTRAFDTPEQALAYVRAQIARCVKPD